jgi:hypothetical protein
MSLQIIGQVLIVQAGKKMTLCHTRHSMHLMDPVTLKTSQIVLVLCPSCVPNKVCINQHNIPITNNGIRRGYGYFISTTASSYTIYIHTVYLLHCHCTVDDNEEIRMQHSF